MQRKILVPLDGLPLAEKALPLAAYLADILGAGLDLVSVVPAEASSHLVAHRYLERVAAATGRPADIRLMRGEAGPCIVREANAAAVGLVVMATHARAGVTRAVLGSVAQYVVAHASVPVLLIPPHASRKAVLNTVLVAIDRTTAAPVNTLLDLARAAAAHIVLLSVVAPEEIAIWQWQRGPLLDEPQAVAATRRQLEDLATRLREAGVAAEARVAVGSAAHLIQSTAETIDADLIVMCTHARGGAQRAVQGSVTDAVVHTANRPVLACRLIPPPPAEVRQIDLFHAMQRRTPRSRPTSIPAPLQALRPH